MRRPPCISTSIESATSAPSDVVRLRLAVDGRVVAEVARRQVEHRRLGQHVAVDEARPRVDQRLRRRQVEAAQHRLGLLAALLLRAEQPAAAVETLLLEHRTAHPLGRRRPHRARASRRALAVGGLVGPLGVRARQQRGARLVSSYVGSSASTGRIISSQHVEYEPFAVRWSGSARPSPGSSSSGPPSPSAPPPGLAGGEGGG
eukprot:3503007-Prymnesium_polylepis.1